MPQIVYVDKRFNTKSRSIIETANRIITEYEKQGYFLTLRQLYYQFVSRGKIENTEKSYRRLGNIISDARLAGLIDWNAIEDRTRWVRRTSHWTSPAEILKDCAIQFSVDMWEEQDYRPEVWIEKDALVGVIESVCKQLDVPFFACRGYVSQSEQWRAGIRFKEYQDNNQQPIVFHFGDHDPSGLDMTRDNENRLNIFSDWSGVEVRRLALNMNQINQYNPPPNPTKITDRRAAAYISKFGSQSWELDALEPMVIESLIKDNIIPLIDQGKWDKAKQRERKGQALLEELSDKISKQQQTP